MSERDWQLASEAEDLLRIMPTAAEFKTSSRAVDEWIGRFLAFVDLWRPLEIVTANHHLGSRYSQPQYVLDALRQMIYRAKHSVRHSIGAPTSAVVARGQVFDYFDSVRKVIEQAGSDVLFIDPYISAEFVSTYLPHVSPAAKIRLLTTAKRLNTVVPALRLFAQQRGGAAELRTDENLHDRYVFIDGQEGYQSGASFKDGARNAPTALTQVIDTFAAVYRTYETAWNSAAVVAVG